MKISKSTDNRGAKNPNWKGGLVETECAICGKKFKVNPSDVDGRKTCSYKCCAVYRSRMGFTRGEKNPNWNGGTSFEPYTSEFNENLKRQVRERDGNRCVCGLTNLEHMALFGYPLHVHHTDGDKKNSSLSNLLTLGQYCHNRWHGRFGF